MSLQIPAINESDAAETVSASTAVFGQAFNETLVHQLVTSYLANARSGTKAQKNRAAVSGGGRKPWRQKGTGRARAGTIRSPLWRGGGVTFAASNRSYKQKLNKKMYRAGMRSILSELLRQNRLLVSEDIYPSEPKTKVFVDKLKAYGVRGALIVADREDQNLALASRNVPGVDVCLAENVDPVSLIAAEKVIVTPQAVKHLEERLG